MSDAQNAAAVDRARQQATQFKDLFQKVKAEVGKAMVGQEEVVDGALTALIVGGHVLLEGVPGLGKTLLVRTLSQAVHLKFSRIQFTPDLMPADIQGTMLLTETEGGGQELSFQEGPLVANLVLADEINRATPKTQSALLEAMQERQITSGKRTIPLEEPYCVMATQNPVEQEGTYPLPEAQLDRFLFKLIVGYPAESEYQAILDRTTGVEEAAVEAVADGPALLELRAIARSVAVPEAAKRYAVRLVMATQPESELAPDGIRQYASLGASPRGVQGLILAAKVLALRNDRFALSTEDLRAVSKPVLRHRLVLNFHAQASQIAPDALIEDVLQAVKLPHSVD